ncbi:MAG: hypothetical protein GY874_10605 [Desulfobacteraceae bacterium]|nr:hypothetical protein [Desulfobacteraceae bacterium]
MSKLIILYLSVAAFLFLCPSFADQSIEILDKPPEKTFTILDNIHMPLESYIDDPDHYKLKAIAAKLGADAVVLNKNMMDGVSLVMTEERVVLVGTCIKWGGTNENSGKH